MALQKTSLVVVSAPIPEDFIGSPQDFQAAIIERMSIQSPAGFSAFVVGDSEPSGNQGPWLAFGDRWEVFSVTAGRYVPINIDDSLHIFLTGPNTPPAPTADQPELLWLRTFETRAVGFYGWDGVTWRPTSNGPASGATSARPTNPFPFENFFDTDINVLIQFERGTWRTVSGSPGDVKAVAASELSVALTLNPGWIYFGLADQSIRGRVIGIASQDPGGSPASAFPTDSGISARASGDKVGEETHVLTSVEIEQHTHLIGHATALNSDNNVQIHRVENTDDISIPPTVPPNYFEVLGDGGANGTKTGTAGDGPTGTMLITSKQLSLAGAAQYTASAQAHENLQPSVFLWHLLKL